MIHEWKLLVLENLEILRVRDIMTIFQVDRETVYNWKRKGKLHMKKIGGMLYARREDVEKLMS